MPVLKVIKTIGKKPSFARLSPLAKGRVIGLREAGTERKDIAERVKKNDGKSPSIVTVDSVLERFKEEPDWDGLEDRDAGGRPRDLTSQQLCVLVLGFHVCDPNKQQTVKGHALNGGPPRAPCMILCEKAMGKYRVVKCTINRDHFMHHNIPE